MAGWFKSKLVWWKCTSERCWFITSDGCPRCWTSAITIKKRIGFTLYTIFIGRIASFSSSLFTFSVNLTNSECTVALKIICWIFSCKIQFLQNGTNTTNASVSYDFPNERRAPSTLSVESLHNTETIFSLLWTAAAFSHVLSSRERNRFCFRLFRFFLHGHWREWNGKRPLRLDNPQVGREESLRVVYENCTFHRLSDVFAVEQMWLQEEQVFKGQHFSLN